MTSINRSQALFERSLKVAPGGVHSPVRAFKSVGGTPVFFESAEGAYLQDVDGQKYIDYCMSFGPLLLGHRDPVVQEAAHAMLGKAWSFGACEPYSLELAEYILNQVGFIQKLRFVSSGTEAVMSAVRVARAATGRRRILKFNGCYHGHVDSLLVKSGSGLAGLASSDSAGVSSETAAETLVCDLNDDEGLKKVFQEFGSQIAAVIVEPLPANYGLLVQRKEFLALAQSLCRKHGALLIFDEVISGFRVGAQGMAGILCMNPDLVTYGKILGGGFPVGCYGGKKELMDLVAPSGPVYQAGTLSANPMGMVAGLATLKRIKELNLYSLLEERGQKFEQRLNQGFEKAGVNWRISRFASLFWMHARTDQPIRTIQQIPPGHAESYKPVFHRLLKDGVYLAPSSFEVGFFSYQHTEEILNQTAEKILTAVLSDKRASPTGAEFK